MFAGVVILSLQIASNSYALGPIVRSDRDHWRLFLESPSEKRPGPVALTFDGKVWKQNRMLPIQLEKKVIWEANVTGSGELKFAFWIDSKSPKSELGVFPADGLVLDSTGSHGGGAINPMIADPAKFSLADNPRWGLMNTIYRIEVDRFESSKGGGIGNVGGTVRRGGNFAGILKHIDFLVSLGANSILLSPIAEASDPFGRNVTDPKRLNHWFGESADLKDVVTELQRNNMRVLAEGPIPDAIPALDGAIGDSHSGGWRIAPERPVWNFPAGYSTGVVTRWFDLVKNWLQDPDASAVKLEAALQVDRDQLPDTLVNGAVHELGDQDEPRAATIFKDKTHLQQAVTLLFTYPGIPLIRSGDEAGLRGGRFPESKDPMPWNPNEQDASILQFYKNMIGLRSSRPSLWRGSYESLLSDDDKGLFAFVRRDRFEATVVFVNNSDKAQSYSTAAGRFGENLVDLIGNAGFGVVNGILSVNISAHSVAVIGTTATS